MMYLMNEETADVQSSLIWMSTYADDDGVFCSSLAHSGISVSKDQPSPEYFQACNHIYKFSGRGSGDRLRPHSEHFPSTSSPSCCVLTFSCASSSQIPTWRGDTCRALWTILSAISSFKVCPLHIKSAHGASSLYVGSLAIG